MLIDLICDRMNGQSYIARDFYNELVQYSEHFKSYVPVIQALDGGTDADVQAELCHYIDVEQYNSQIKEYVCSVKWLTDDTDPKKTLKRDSAGRCCWVHVVNVNGKFYAVAAHGWGTEDEMQREKWGCFQAARLFKKTATVHTYGLMQDGTFRHYCSANAQPWDEILSPFTDEAIHGTERPDGIEFDLSATVTVADAQDQRNGCTGTIAQIESDENDGHIIYTVVFPGCTEDANGTKFNTNIGTYVNGQLNLGYTVPVNAA